MAIQYSLEIDGGHEWHVAAGSIFGGASPKRGELVIPLSSLESMSAEEIGRLAKESIPHLYTVAADSVCYDVIGGVGSGVSSDAYERLSEDDLALIDEYASEEMIDRMMQAVSASRAPKPPKKPRKKPGYVYLAYCETGHYKIGRSKGPRDRIKALDTKMPVKIELLHSFPADDYVKAEEGLHRAFEDKRVNGEWFDLEKEDLRALMSITEAKDGEFIFAESATA